jgi:hypothetical protein
MAIFLTELSQRMRICGSDARTSQGKTQRKPGNTLDLHSIHLCAQMTTLQQLFFVRE